MKMPSGFVALILVKIAWNSTASGHRPRSPDLHPEGFAAPLEVLGNAEAVGLLVVQDVDVLDALRLCELGITAPWFVAGSDARVVTLALG